jgi:hypothetical protein
VEKKDQDARWQAILEAQAEIVREAVPLHPASRAEGARRPTSKSQQFDDALSDLGSWSSVDTPRRRMSA